jgi:hypothetical protein
MIGYAALLCFLAPMVRLRIVLAKAPLCVVALLLLSACGSTTIRYRLTLQVDIDGVAHMGSGVIETEWTYYPKWLQGLTTPWRVEIHGEAVVVDLGSRGLLFALLTGPAAYDHGHPQRINPTNPQAVLRYFNYTGRDGLTQESLDGLARRRDIIDIPISGLPMLVRFGDIRDPGTMVQVNPDDLARYFGPDARLVRATLAITDSPVSRGIEDRLSWLNGLKKRNFSDGGPLSPMGTEGFQQ